MKSRLLLAVGQIIGEKQWSIQKDLLHLRLGNAVLFVFPCVSFVPVEPGVEHARLLYMSAIYRIDGNLASKLTPQACRARA